MKTKILIIGGSYAGVKAGKTLHKIFRKSDDVEITLIDKNPFHTLMTELHEVAGHRTEADSIKIDLRKIFRGRKVTVVTDEIIHCDMAQKRAISAKKTYDFDYLIIAIGSQPNFFGVKGAEENSHTLWSYQDAIKLRAHIEHMFERASYEEDPAERKRLLTFAVCGGGFTGVEMVGEIGESKKHFCTKYTIDPSDVTIYNIEALDRILGMLDSDKLVKKIEDQYFKKLGVTLLKHSAIVEVNPDSFTLANGTVIPSYTLIWSAGIKCVEGAAEFQLDKGKGSRICVNEYMQGLQDGQPLEGIYVAGDCAFYEDAKGFMPQIVQAAEQSAHTAALNIAAEIKGSKELHVHEQKYNGFMVSVGSRRGVANIGFLASGWFAIFVKHFVNVYYQFMVAGFMQVANYLRHEIFNIKNKRSFVGGHFSKRSPNFWMVPFRLWLGFMWLTEGVVKISEGWFKSPQVVNTVNYLAGTVANGAKAAADAVSAATGAAQGAADAVSAATGVVQGAADAVTAASGAAAEVANQATQVAAQLPGIFQWVVNHKPAGYGDALINAPKFVVWIMNHWIAPIEVPVQIMMVIMEILIGLSFMGGLFTFPMALISIVMTIAIAMTGMADITMMWYFFGAIAILMGAGRTFGLDYYVIPWLKKRWIKTKLAGKSYLYYDHTDDE
ncbi:MAG: NAD(P)/FAD-dependent oxidoreductase [Christensenella sp.]|nr:NAD(P)/FAD-dependent oxidoreductase [Christensenella sp.]